MSQIDPGHNHHDPDYPDYRGECSQCLGYRWICTECDEPLDGDDRCSCSLEIQLLDDPPEAGKCDRCEGTGEEHQPARPG